jgi:hypothetical protein
VTIRSTGTAHTFDSATGDRDSFFFTAGARVGLSGGEHCHPRLMPTPAPLPEDLTSRAFTTREALARGIRASRLRARDISQPVRGVNLASRSEPTFIQRCRALMRVLPPSSFVSHGSAARLYGFPVGAAGTPSIHVTVPAPYRAPRRAQVIGHRATLTGTEWMRSAGFAHSTAARAWVELASTSLTLEDVVVAGDYLVRARETRRGYRPLATLEELRAAAEQSADRRGSRLVSAALERYGKASIHRKRRSFVCC